MIDDLPNQYTGLQVDNSALYVLLRADSKNTILSFQSRQVFLEKRIIFGFNNQIQVIFSNFYHFISLYI